MYNKRSNYGELEGGRIDEEREEEGKETRLTTIEVQKAPNPALYARNLHFQEHLTTYLFGSLV